MTSPGDNRIVVLLKSLTTNNRFYTLVPPDGVLQNGDVIAEFPNHLPLGIAYPCLEETWKSLRERNLLFNRASLGVGTRRIDLLLTALPMSTKVFADMVDLMAREVVAIGSE